MARMTEKFMLAKFGLVQNTFPSWVMSGSYGRHQIQERFEDSSRANISGLLSTAEMVEFCNGVLATCPYIRELKGEHKNG